ncbi:MAG TPA: sigma-70 family RNA polymerase sigma factor [Gaiellaceae bacterium]|nr:sigma-70 family RNA polymerase sigma factor [Gaiellaceae bacterium]
MTAPTGSDKELWQLVQANDRHAFGVLFERHAEAVYNYSFRRTADWAAAEDLVSSVFLEAWRRRADLELTSQSERLLPWLLGVATNLLRTRNRSAARLARALLRERTGSDEPDFADDAVRRVADAQRMKAVLSLIRALPRGTQDVLALYAWAGLSYEEVSASLGIPIGTVRSRLSRARLYLEKLEPVIVPRKESEVPNEAW